MTAAVFAASALITLAFWSALPSSMLVNESSDFKNAYEPLARSLTAGNGYYLGGYPHTRYPPGYPLILMVLFSTARVSGLSEPFLLSALACLAMAFTSALIFAVASRLWGLRAGLVSAFSWMTYPFALWLTKQPNSELPFMMLLHTALFLLWSATLDGKQLLKTALTAGLLAGFAMLIRPIALCLGVLLAALLLASPNLTRKMKWSAAVLVLLGNAVVVLPWQAWVYSQTGRIILLSTSTVPALRDGLTFGVLSRGYRQPVSLPRDVVELMEYIRERYYELGSASDVVSLMAQQLSQRPATVVKMIGIKAARSWYATDSNRMALQTAAIQILYLVFLGYSTKCAWKLGGASRSITVAVWIITAYFWAMTTSALSILRYMVPAIGLLFVLLGAPFARLQPGPAREK